MNFDLAKRAKWWVGVYEYHQSEITSAIAMAYAKDTCWQTEEEIEKEWVEWRRENKKPPMPCDLNGDKIKSKRVADNIWRSLNWLNWPSRKDNGGFNIIDEEFVYAHVGTLSAEVMKMHGGFHVLRDLRFDQEEHWMRKGWEQDALFLMSEARTGQRNFELGSTKKEIVNLLDFKKMPEKGGPRPNFEDFFEEQDHDNV